MDRGEVPLAPRALPAPLARLSSLTISIDPPAVSPPAIDARWIALLQKARRLGVTSFDVSVASLPERAERLLARAFPGGDPGIIALVGRSVESLAREPTPNATPTSPRDLAATLGASLERSRRRLAPVPIGVVEWTPAADESPPSLPSVGSRPPSPPDVPEPLWALRLLSPDEPAREGGTELRLFSGRFSILEPDLGSRFEALGMPPRSFLIAREPFSAGRLDGSRFAMHTSLAGPALPPVDVRRLHEEFDPVLQLGFLTAGHRRTLARAALRFVLHWPWVASAVVPLPDPERLEEVLGFGSTPPISSEELERLRHLK